MEFCRSKLVVNMVFASAICACSMSVQAATYVVINTNDSGIGSLRQSILDANANPGTDSIHFTIPGAGWHKIRPASVLPSITDTVIIDGYTEPGSLPASTVAAANINIILDGSLLAPWLAIDGLTIEADNSQVRGLVINRFAGNGIVLNSNGSTVQGSYIGTNRVGDVEKPNEVVGIDVRGDNNQIGSTRLEGRNVISGNLKAGVQLGGNDNIMQGNVIGLDPSTTIDIGNGYDSGGGVLVYGNDNLIGGLEEGALNVISGNHTGVEVLGQAKRTRIEGNIIGTDITGSVADFWLGNITGVRLNTFGIGAANATVVGPANIISNNIGEGIEVIDHSNTITGNLIGTDISGTYALGNGPGILITGSNNQVGGDTVDDRNVISGNDSAGILVQPNLSILDPDVWIGTPRANRIQGNYIGTDISGGYAIPNGYSGIHITDAHWTLVGGEGEGEGNVISGNEDDGVHLRQFQEERTTRFNRVLGNTVGMDATQSYSVANTASGVRINGATDTRIGGTADGAANLIAFNGTTGVAVDLGGRNAIVQNVIHDNGTLGIDLLSDGVTPNDALDGDTGPNGLQNSGLITGAAVVASNLEVDYQLSSTPATDFRIEVFSSASCDSSGHGEADTFLGSVVVTTGNFGFVSGTASWVSTASPGDSVSMTVTKKIGGLFTSTSEFSECVQVP